MPVVIRFAYPDDAPALAGLAALDEGSVPTPPVLLAEVEGRLWAALSVATDAHVADPFLPSGELVELLRHRARQLRARSRATGGGSFPAQLGLRRLVFVGAPGRLRWRRHERAT